MSGGTREEGTEEGREDVRCWKRRYARVFACVRAGSYVPIQHIIWEGMFIQLGLAGCSYGWRGAVYVV